jgi:archaellum component FlaC
VEGVRRIALARLDELERSFQAVSSRLGSMEARLASLADDLTARIAAQNGGGMGEEGVAGMETRLAEGLRREVERVLATQAEFRDLQASEVQETIVDRLTQVVDGLRASLASLEERVADLGAGPAERLASLEERLEAASESAGNRMSSTVDAFSASVTERLTEMRDEMARASAEQPALQERIDAIRDVLSASLAGLRDRMDSVAESVRPVRDELDGLRREVGEPVRRVDEGLSRVDSLADAIDELGKRRGFRKAAEAEERLAREQAAYVDRLASAGSALGERVEEVGRKLELLESSRDQTERLVASVEELRGRIPDLHRELRESVSEDLKDVVAERWSTAVDDLRLDIDDAISEMASVKALRDVSRAQRDLEQTVLGLRATVGAIRGRLDEWGRPRTTRRLGLHVESLEARVAELERALREARRAAVPPPEPSPAPAEPPRRRRWFGRS